MKTRAEELGITIFPYKEYNDEYGNLTYYENSDGEWVKWEYDENGNLTYQENSDGWWVNYKYNKNRKVTYYEDDDGEKTYTII